MRSKIKTLSRLAIVLIILGSLLFFHWRNINAFPSKIHAWSQSDRYALALGFLNNNFDLFHPQTYNLTESPYLNPAPRSTSITAVDFPINDYSAALIMKLFGTTDPWCFRVYTLIYSLIGLVFLFLLSMYFLKNRWLALFVVLFCLTSPVYLYYQVGFLPSIPAISNLFIGLYLFVRHLESKKLWQYSLAIFFITIAVLSRKPFLFFLLSTMLYQLWLTIKSKKINIREVIVLAVSTTTILAYFFYNRYLEHKYGSAFLNYFLPPENLGHAIEIIVRVFKQWVFQYFTWFHYLVMLGLMVLAVISFKKRTSQNSPKDGVLLTIILTSTFCFILYFIAMMRQFPDHDYYFLDSFYPVICLFLIYLVSKLPFDSNGATAFGGVGFLVFTVLLFTVNRGVQQKREVTGPWDVVELTTNNFDGADKLLDQNNIPPTAKILVFDSYTTNIPFIKMKRYGYTMMSKKPKDIKSTLAWNYDYVVMQDCFTLSGIVRIYPQIKNELERIGGNGKLSIYKKHKSEGTVSGFRFLKIDTKTPLLFQKIDFDSPAEDCWHNITSTLVRGSQFNVSGIMTDSIDYSATLSIKNSSLLANEPRVLFLSVDIYSDEKLSYTPVIASIDADGKQLYCNSFDLGELVDTLSTWKHIDLVFPVLPSINSTDSELKVYIWNSGKHRFYYDNLSIGIVNL
jgi:hypothetical protein